MKTTSLFGAAVALLALPLAAQAEGFSLDAGVAGTYTVTGDGFDHVENYGEGYVEGSYSGFFGGIWIASLYEDLTNNYEMELYAGYGNELDSGLSYSLSATAYYLENSYDDYYVTLELGYGITDAISLGGAVEYYPDLDETDISASVEYAFSDAISAFVLLGTIDGVADSNYAEVGASYSFAEGAAFSVLYEDAEAADSFVTFILSYDFNVFGG